MNALMGAVQSCCCDGEDDPCVLRLIPCDIYADYWWGFGHLPDLQTVGQCLPAGTVVRTSSGLCYVVADEPPELGLSVTDITAILDDCDVCIPEPAGPCTDAWPCIVNLSVSMSIAHAIEFCVNGQKCIRTQQMSGAGSGLGIATITATGTVNCGALGPNIFGTCPVGSGTGWANVFGDVACVNNPALWGYRVGTGVQGWEGPCPDLSSPSSKTVIPQDPYWYIPRTTECPPTISVPMINLSQGEGSCAGVIAKTLYISHNVFATLGS